MSRGHNIERRIKGQLEDEGWLVVRAAGSLGIVDLIALREDSASNGGIGLENATEALLIECKGDKDYPFAHFGPTKQWALHEAGQKCNASAFLAWAKPRAREVKWIPSSSFPAIKAAA